VTDDENSTDQAKAVVVVSRVVDVILETRGLTKEFRGFTAVQGVDLKIRRGMIHALIGPNGAGKTTVFNLLTKFLHPPPDRSFTTAATSPPSIPPRSPVEAWCDRSRSLQSSRI
jgi:ABC-type glutathione transport system ATPase component